MKKYQDFCAKDFLEILENIKIKNFKNKKRRFAVFDFETDNKEEPKVYSWGFLEENYKFSYGTKIETFFELLENQKRNIILYSQNGSKFDNYFIIPYLIKLGYKENYSWIDNIIDIGLEDNLDWLTNYLNFFKNRIFEEEKLNGDFKEKLKLLTNKELDIFEKYKIIDEILQENKKLKRRRLFPNEFQLIIEENYKNFEIKLLTNSNKLITFRDALLIFPGGLKNKSKTLVQTYNHNDFLKKELKTGYGKKLHYNDLKEFEEDSNELSYLFYDCLILLVYLIDIDFSFSRKYWKMTAGSTAYNRWKYGFFTEKLAKKYLEKGLVEKITLTRGDEKYRFKGQKKWINLKKIKDKLFKEFFYPKAQELIQNDILDNWFFGGLTSFNPQNQGLLLDNLFKIDINSSYPSVMLNEILPYGWIEEEEKEGCDFKFYRVFAKSNLINKEGLPFIKVLNKNKFKPYANVIPKGTYIYLTSAEIKNFKKYYKGNYELIVKYHTRTISGAFLFKEYIDYYYNLKSNAKNEGEKIVAKLMLNSLYGKFGTKRIRTQRVVEQNGKGFLKITNQTENEYYAPIATAITAYGRMKLVDLIGKNYEIFIGGDTDSVIIPQKYLPILKKLNFLDNKELGKWKVEMEDMKGIFRRKKQYFYQGIEGEKEKYSFAFASLNSSNMDLDHFTFQEFLFGKKIPEQTRPKRTPMGIIIENFIKEIPPIYQKNYQQTDLGLNLWFSDGDSFASGYKEQLKKRKEVIENYKWKY